MGGQNIDEAKISLNLINSNLPLLMQYQFPDCATQNGKYLKTSGTAFSWDTPAGGAKVETHIPLITIATAVSI